MKQELEIDKRKTIVYYCKQSVFWIYLFFMFLYGIIMISLIASGHTELTNLKQSEAYILGQESVKQWNQKFMIELTAQDGDCPQGYESLIDHKWAGTVDGCGCDFESNNITQTIVVKGKCNSELLGYGCFDIDQQNAQTANKWKNEKKICALRDNKWSMIDSLDDKCELGDIATLNYKKCGSGQRAVCRQNSDECPIQMIQNKIDYVGEVQDINELVISDDVTYTYQSDQEGYIPIMNFRFDEYEHCLNPNQMNISPNKTGEYILLNDRRENCFQEESRTKAIDYIGEEDFFRNNEQIWNIQMNELPGYQRPSNLYTYKLSYQPYPYWSFECRNGQDYNLKQAVTRLGLENEIEADDNLIIVSCICITFISLILVLVEIRKKIYRQRELIKIQQIQSDEKRYKVIMGQIPKIHQNWLNNTIIVIVVDKLFKILNIVFIFFSFIEIENSKEWFEGVESKVCGDSFYVTNVQEQYLSSTYEMFQYISAMMGLWWAVITIDIIFLIFRYIDEIKPTLLALNGNKQRVLPTKKKEEEKKLQQDKNGKKNKKKDSDDIDDEVDEEEEDDDDDDEEELHHEDDDEEEKLPDIGEDEHANNNKKSKKNLQNSLQVDDIELKDQGKSEGVMKYSNNRQQQNRGSLMKNSDYSDDFESETKSNKQLHKNKNKK